jgi:ribosomal protein S18 acetylase RimI-like enzyme
MNDNLKLVELRPATKSDLDSVADVWHKSAMLMDGATATMPSRDELRVRIGEELASGWQLHIALRGSHPVGMLALKPAHHVVDQIFVLPSEQRRGIGKALLNLAKHTMAEGFTLRTASSNGGACRFYEREGLTLIRQGVHPRSGDPVHFYGWNVS